MAIILVVISIALLSLFILPISSHAASNLGWIWLNSIKDTSVPNEAGKRSVQLMQRATELYSENFSAWRGMGYGLVKQGSIDEAFDIWEKIGGMEGELIENSRLALLKGSYEEAELWADLATKMAPQHRDAWFYKGLVLDTKGEWARALDAFQKASSAKESKRVEKSRPFYFIGILNQWRLSRPAAAIEAYNAAISWNEFLNESERAEAHYKKGELMLWQNIDPAEYIVEFQQTIEIVPDHWRAHMLLGVAFYTAYNDVSSAEKEINAAIDLYPNNASAYRHLGDIYVQDGRINDAKAMYDKALDIDPSLDIVRNKLEDLLD